MIAAAFTLQDGEVLMAISVAFFAGVFAVAFLWWLNRPRQRTSSLQFVARWSITKSLSEANRMIASLRMQAAHDAECLTGLRETLEMVTSERDALRREFQKQRLTMNETLTPKNFRAFPFSSVTQNAESETVACNIMKIRTRLGNRWELTWEKYKTERLKDGGFTEGEKHYFDEVLPRISTPANALTFSPVWAKAAARLMAA